ncbi:hypothetical protein HY947_02520 [Candidatus Gottesmanbacteria bacterium]|nr:hypothetical protein [Candidatus Gottesmanbacteria bacterium]
MDKTNAIEPEIVHDEKLENDAIPAASDATVLLSIESLIKEHATAIDKGRTELKKYREMLESALLNDETYRIHSEKVKEAIKVKSATKSQIMQIPGNKTLSEKVKELAAGVKDAQNELSDYLREFLRISGTNEIEGEDGEIHEIVSTAKLIKRSRGFNQ